MHKRDSGHVPVTESVQNLVRVDITSEDEGVLVPRAKAEVIFINIERQLERVEFVLSARKNVVQG